MLEAETRFRKVPVYRARANLAIAIEHDRIRRRQGVTHLPGEEAVTPAKPGSAATSKSRVGQLRRVPSSAQTGSARLVVEGARWCANEGAARW